MRLLVLLAMITKVTSKTVVCDGMIFNDVYYDKEVLFTGLGKPNNLLTHRFTGYIFFSHQILKDQGKAIDFEIKACHIASKKCSSVSGLTGGYALGYDAFDDSIFMGGQDGIYLYNFLTKNAMLWAAEDKNIWALFVKRQFYYIQYPSLKLYVLQDEGFVKVAEAMNTEIEHFYISKDGCVYFSNKTALYKVEAKSKNPVVLNDDLVVRQIAEDTYGDVYFCGSDGIYVEDKPYRKIKCLAKIEEAYGLTFDEQDRIVYSDATGIYRLDKSNYSEVCYAAIRGPVAQPPEPVTTLPLRGEGYRLYNVQNVNCTYNLNNVMLYVFE